MAGYIGNQAQIRSGLSATIDELNIIDGVTATTAELNTLAGVTAVVGELNALDIGSTAVGTAVASKAVILDSNKDYTGLRNVTATGVATVGSVVVADGGNIGAASDTDSLAIASNGVVTFSQAPVFPDGSLNLADLDIDGGTDINAALVDADLMIVDDGAGGTNRKATMSRLATYMGTKIGGGVEFISSVDVSAVTNIAFTGFDSSKYDSYIFNFAHITPDTDGASFFLRTSTDGGSNYDSGSANYFYSLQRGRAGANGTARTDHTDGANTYANLAGGVGIASSPEALIAISGTVELYFPHLAEYTVGYVRTYYVDSAGNLTAVFGGFNRNAQSDVDAVQFGMSSGDFAAGGTITMYGVVNS